jgi:hypothetical protein
VLLDSFETREKILREFLKICPFDGWSKESLLKAVSKAGIEEKFSDLIFENGLMLDLKTWEGVAKGLNNCCDLLFYNRPGVGRSESEQAALSPGLSAARLQHLIQQQ